MIAIDRMIAVAGAELGYLEKKSNKDLDSKTANAGSANYYGLRRGCGEEKVKLPRFKSRV